MPTDYMWQFKITREYNSRDLHGSGAVEIYGGTFDHGEVQRIHFPFYAEAQAFLAWAFAGKVLAPEYAPSPESVARWKRMLEEAGVEWDWEDEPPTKPPAEVKSPASEADLVREGILPNKEALAGQEAEITPLRKELKKE